MKKYKWASTCQSQETKGYLYKYLNSRWGFFFSKIRKLDRGFSIGWNGKKIKHRQALKFK